MILLEHRDHFNECLTEQGHAGKFKIDGQSSFPHLAEKLIDVPKARWRSFAMQREGDKGT
jgi:hypothetical protein